MRVAVSGATGYIGSALARDLTADGIDVVRLVRVAGRQASGPGEIGWDPDAGRDGVDPSSLSGLNAVVHLSGAPIAARRWTAARKQVLRASRIDSTRVLAAAMAETDPRPDVLICASATGYYGDTGDRVVDESSARGSGFLAELVGDWEAAAEPARAAGIRVVHIRSGLVFGPAGGMVGRLLLPFRLGVGARVGSGRQYMSWISLTDEVRAIRFLLDTPGVGGPVNLTAPEAVPNADFTRALAAALRRPAVLRAPGSALRLALGEVASELLVSARVRPAKLLESGFEYTYPELADALALAVSHAAR
jgi:uncharacterized protein